MSSYQWGKHGDDRPVEARLDRLGSEHFQVSPAAGGGPGPCAAAMGRKLADLVEHGCFCVVIASAAESRLFVQVVATPVGLHAEAVSNEFLRDTDFELTSTQEARLADLGWRHPEVAADGSVDRNGSAVNWWLDLQGVAGLGLAANLLVDTIIGVYAVDDGEVLDVRIFPSHIQRWRWVDDGVGRLKALDRS